MCLYKLRNDRKDNPIRQSVKPHKLQEGFSCIQLHLETQDEKEGDSGPEEAEGGRWFHPRHLFALRSLHASHHSLCKLEGDGHSLLEGSSGALSAGLAKGLCTDAGCSRRCVQAAGNGTGASRVLQPFLHPSAYVPYFRGIFKPHLRAALCEPEARSLPAAPQQKRQRCLKVSFVPHFCSENGKIPWKIGRMKVSNILAFNSSLFNFSLQKTLLATLFDTQTSFSYLLLFFPAHTIYQISSLLPSWCKDKTFGVRSQQCIH